MSGCKKCFNLTVSLVNSYQFINSFYSKPLSFEVPWVWLTSDIIHICNWTCFCPTDGLICSRRRVATVTPNMDSLTRLYRYSKVTTLDKVFWQKQNLVSDCFISVSRPSLSVPLCLSRSTRPGGGHVPGWVQLSGRLLPRTLPWQA